jgi:hypothetical protein
MRTISDHFLDDLSSPEGVLHPVLERVKRDNTLLLSIRENNVNIYYRGGNLLKVTEKKPGLYTTYFDSHYNLSGTPLPETPGTLATRDDAAAWAATFALHKNLMDEYFSVHPKAEREFQQIVARENNDSTISNESEYFISDIEFADDTLGARFDLLAIRWLANQRKDGSKCRAALMEMKYSDGALSGSAGISKHLKDIEAMVSDRARYAALLQTMELQFNQLDRLGLLRFNKGVSNAQVRLDVNDRPEVIFILANHNPRSGKLAPIINDPDVDHYANSGLFDLRFFVASFAGYGLHTDCMLSLEEFRKVV